MEAIRQEVGKLLSVGFFKEMEYPDWVSNVVMVKMLMNNGECALILLVFTRLVQKIIFLCPQLIDWWMRYQAIGS